jgi:hypothetical protein
LGQEACRDCLRAHALAVTTRRKDRPYRGRPRSDPLVEDAEWLAGTGQGVERLLEAAATAGRSVTAPAARRALDRAGRLDLWRRLRANDGDYGEGTV